MSVFLYLFLQLNESIRTVLKRAECAFEPKYTTSGRETQRTNEGEVTASSIEEKGIEGKGDDRVKGLARRMNYESFQSEAEREINAKEETNRGGEGEAKKKLENQEIGESFYTAI